MRFPPKLRPIISQCWYCYAASTKKDAVSSFSEQPLPQQRKVKHQLWHSVIVSDTYSFNVDWNVPAVREWGWEEFLAHMSWDLSSLRFKGHFSRLTWLAGYLKRKMREVPVTTGAISRAKPQSNRDQEMNTQLFTGRVSFLSSNNSVNALKEWRWISAGTGVVSVTVQLSIVMVPNYTISRKVPLYMTAYLPAFVQESSRQRKALIFIVTVTITTSCLLFFSVTLCTGTFPHSTICKRWQYATTSIHCVRQTSNVAKTLNKTATIIQSSLRSEKAL